MICTWNVRGAGKKGFVNSVSDLRKIFLFEVLVVLEPRISGVKACKVIDKMGFSNNFVVEASGFSGGIWLLWNDSRVKLKVVASSRYSITMVIARALNFGFSRWFMLALILLSEILCGVISVLL